MIVHADEGNLKTQSPMLKLQERDTGAGVHFVMLGERGPRPKPVIVCLAATGAETLQTEPFRVSGQELARQGWLVVSLDLPGHGREHREGEPAGIAAWRGRIEKGEPLVDDLTRRVTAVLDFLIAEGAVEPTRIAIEGTSRGGFLAAHVATREPRFKAIVMYVPVTDLQYLREFHGLEKNPRLQGLALSQIAEKLCDRKLWLIIGNDDERVNTDSAIQFTREVVRAAKQRKLPASVTLHVSATPGHSSDAQMHLDAVKWLQKQLPGRIP